MPTPKFPISHVLVDCENVGLNGLTDLVVNTDGSPLKFVLFHNSTNKINLSLTQLKDFGYALSEGRIELVELAIPEKMTKKQAENALDFYIAFYMGQVMPREPFNSHCVILSKDHDYDPLVAVRRRPLRTRGIVRRTGETPGASREASRSEKGRCAQEARSAAGEGHEEGCATKGV